MTARQRALVEHAGDYHEALLAERCQLLSRHGHHAATPAALAGRRKQI
jgi:hypothetical protein